MNCIGKYLGSSPCMYVLNYVKLSYKVLVGEVVSMPQLLSDTVEHFRSM